MASSRRLGQVLIKNTALFLCDMQEKFRPTIQYFPQIVEVASRMFRAAKIMEIPLIIVTEQYPKGLGPTVPELGINRDSDVYSKTCFTMCLPEIEQKLKDAGTTSVVLCGIETQVCIQKTALDLLERGLDVHVIADACSSRSMVDRMYAFERMRQSGAFITTSEAMLLQLLGGSMHPSFKGVQKIITTSAPDSGLLRPGSH